MQNEKGVSDGCVPSIRQVLGCYRTIAAAERTLVRRDDDARVRHAQRDLRGLGFSGSKASYELRKICIDHIYQRFGAEKAVSISGDDIRTISRYYADPAQPNIGCVRVLDLL